MGKKAKEVSWGTVLPVVAFGVSLIAAVTVWSEVTYRGFLPLPVVTVPALSLTALGLSVGALTRSAVYGGRALAALGLLLSLGAMAVVLLLFAIAWLYKGS